MKRTLQKVECVVPANKNAQFSGELRQDYAHCTAVFFTNSNYDTVTARLTIAGREVLPAGTNISLFNFNGNFARQEAAYDLTKEDIPAKSSEYQFDFVNPTPREITIICYFELQND